MLTGVNKNVAYGQFQLTLQLVTLHISSVQLVQVMTFPFDEFTGLWSVHQRKY